MTPSSPQTLFDGPCMETQFSFPFGCGASDSIQREHAIRGSILRLHIAKRPDAVTWLVAFIVIDTFESVRWRWLWSHISKKTQKVLRPASSHVDASAAVSWIRANLGISAARFSGRPRAIFAGLDKTVAESSCAGGFLRQAPTTTDNVISECCPGCDRHVSAITPTGPTRQLTRWAGRCALYCNQSSKALSRMSIATEYMRLL